MELAADLCYRAMRAHDARFDGRFFVGIRSTGIYCRPVCTARTARRENCRFFASAAAAESAGFRPCLRCRPELAPGHASVDASRRLARAAASRIDDGGANEGGIATLARSLGVTARHLRRVFEAEFGVAPVAYAQTARLLLAKRLLTDTTMPATEVALAAGFRSLRRFNSLFASRYRMSPSRLRRSTAPARGADHHAFRLQTRAPFDFEALLRFFAARALDGVEHIDGRIYRRTLAARTPDGRTLAGWLEVRRAARGSGVQLRIDARLAPAVVGTLAACKRAFDLDCRPDDVLAALGPLAQARPGLRLPGAFDGFEMAMRAIVGQQVTVQAARTLAGRLVCAFGAPIETPFAELTTVFPDAARLAQCRPAQLGELGLVGSRARAIVGLARAVADGRIDLTPSAPIEATLAALRELPGVGEWTAQTIAMRALHWPDAFPPGDAGVMKALGLRQAARIAARAERWRPWRAYAVMHLWTSLETS